MSCDAIIYIYINMCVCNLGAQKLMVLKDSRLGGEAARMVYALKPESMVLREAMERRNENSTHYDAVGDDNDGEGVSGAVMRMPAFVQNRRKDETKGRRRDRRRDGKAAAHDDDDDDDDDDDIWMIMRGADVDAYATNMYTEERRRGRSDGIGTPLAGQQREGRALAAKRARREAKERRRSTTTPVHPVHPTVI